MSLLEKLYLRKKNNLAHYDQKLKVCNRNWYEYHKEELTKKEFVNVRIWNLFLQYGKKHIRKKKI